MIGECPKCIYGPCLHYTRPLKCSVYKPIPERIIMGATCKYYVDKAKKV